MIWVENGTDDRIKAFTDRGIECLQELIADIRTWNGGIREFLCKEQCDPETFERIIAHSDSIRHLIPISFGR